MDIRHNNVLYAIPSSALDFIQNMVTDKQHNFLEYFNTIFQHFHTLIQFQICTGSSFFWRWGSNNIRV